jgi:hypothetical protein
MPIRVLVSESRIGGLMLGLRLGLEFNISDPAFENPQFSGKVLTYG